MKKQLSNELRAYLSKLGKKGGKVRSAAKAKAVRDNGKLGGRPSKKKSH